jgi:hypothetical protein
VADQVSRPKPASADQPIDRAYLDSLYSAKPDPWGIAQGFYERRKRDLVMGCLLRERYASAFEPGCSRGELTARLAPRVDRLLAADYHADAVDGARRRVGGLPQVEIAQLLLPDQWPSGRTFDLIVLSELGYFFTPPAWRQLCILAAASLEPQGTVLACHWRHDFAERSQPTDALHHRLDSALDRPRRLHLDDDDFVIDVWSGVPGSIAQSEGKR